MSDKPKAEQEARPAEINPRPKNRPAQPEPPPAPRPQEPGPPDPAEKTASGLPRVEIVEATGCAFKLTDEANGQRRIWASLDGQISWRWVGNLFHRPWWSFIGQPPFNTLDEDDQQTIKAAVEELWPGANISIVKPLPPHLVNNTDL